MRPWLLPLLLAACASPVPPEPPTSRDAPEAAVCRGEDGQVLRQDPRIGAQTGLPTPRSIYTRRAATFRAGPKSDETELFMLEKPLSVVRFPFESAAFIGWRACRTGGRAGCEPVR